MSVSVNIKQNPGKVQQIGLSFVKAIAESESLYFGIPDSSCCYEEYSGGEDIRNQLIILFDRTSYGRGISLTLDDTYNPELVLNYPSAQTDIDVFYRIIKRLCSDLELKTFFQEGDEYKPDDIESLKRESEAANRIYIKHHLKAGLTIFGSIYPITLEKEFIDKIKMLNESQAVQYFESYLDRKQKLDCYFAKPLVYEKKDGKFFARYALTENVPSIFPLKSYLPFGYNQKLSENIDEWAVAIIENKNNRLNLAYEIPFDDFHMMLDRKKRLYFDAKHIIVTVNSEILQKAEKYKIEKYKKDLEAWLEDFRELGHKPFKTEYTKSFEYGQGKKCYIFKYKKSIFGKWFLGIAGDMGTYSKIDEEYKKDTETEAAKDTLRILSEIIENHKGKGSE